MAAAYLSSALSTVSRYLWPNSEKLDAAIETMRKTGFVTCKVLDDSRIQGVFRKGEVCPLDQLSRETLTEEGLEEIQTLTLPCEFEEGFNPEQKAAILEDAEKPDAPLAHKEEAILARHNWQEVTYTMPFERTQLAYHLGFRDCVSLNIWQDQFLPDARKLDTRLACYYQIEYNIEREFLGKRGELLEDQIHAQARDAARRKCDEIRERIFGEKSFSLSATHNRVEGKPEHVIILKGHADSCIGYEINQRGDMYLLAPYQNNGRFFSLDLKDPDVLIVAPSKIAEVWGKTYQIFAHEELTAKQRLFFYHT